MYYAQSLFAVHMRERRCKVPPNSVPTGALSSAQRQGIYRMWLTCFKVLRHKAFGNARSCSICFPVWHGRQQVFNLLTAQCWGVPVRIKVVI